MNLKKNKGSSLIIVVLIFALLTIFGTVILAATVSDYQMRIVESKKTKSLYLSDSGLNITEEILKKLVEQGVKVGNNSVKVFMDDFNTNPDAPEYDDLYDIEGKSKVLNKKNFKKKQNTEFKTAYKAYIQEYIDNSATYLQKGFYPNDVDYLVDYIKDYKDNPDNFNGNDYLKKAENNLKLLYSTDVSNNIKITATPPIASFSSTGVMQFTVNSTFSDPKLAGETSNEKALSAHVTITTPEYGKAYYVQTKGETIKVNPAWKKAIAIDGNMNIDCDLTVNGDVFVKGKPTKVTDSNKVYSKYNGGITIGSDSTGIKAIFSKDVSTPNSFNITGSDNEVDITNGGNVFAGNVYIGKQTALSSSSGLKLNAANNGSIYTNNDLSLNASGSTINIDNYYGVNEISKLKSGGGLSDYNSSSSIIVNSDDIGVGSAISINKAAIIMGAAYINTSPSSYETGESLAIKGNYKAYATPIPDEQTSTDAYYQDLITKYSEGRLSFYDFNSLLLANNFNDTNNTALNIIDKAKYFQLYDHLFSEDPINKSGITLPDNTISIGAVINGGKVSGSSYIGTDEQLNTIIPKRRALASHIYEMGCDGGFIGSLDLLDVYNNYKINRAVFEGDKQRNSATNQTNQVAQVFLDTDEFDAEKIDTTTEEVICRTKDKDVIIVGNDAVGSFSDDDHTEVIDLRATNGVAKGIIITKKNVLVYGKVNFTGTVIVGGDFITAKDNLLKTFGYDENYILNLIAKDYTTYSKIFNEDTPQGIQNVSFVDRTGEGEETGNAINKDLVALDKWKILK
ncbi:hypothetical protein KPL37_11840 [Clostridium frigoris]|uniref:PilX N-terminal n=1 Tax=Clostridium frigoris TaxID=205327 RepID=A0ABS6BVS3_9CLOT|nr:hypothetical protein [Clostridium frigoris]MBU3160435.1 hypothetical protein [Clostridium frigoris]